MPTVPQSFTPRDSMTQSVKYFRQTVNYNSPGVGSTAQQFGVLPKNAFIVDTKVEVVTAFSTGTTVLSCGTTTAAVNIIASADLSVASTGIATPTRAWGTALTSSADTKLYWMMTVTTATAGKANIIISYIADNDA